MVNIGFRLAFRAADDSTLSVFIRIHKMVMTLVAQEDTGLRNKKLTVPYDHTRYSYTVSGSSSTEAFLEQFMQLTQRSDR